MNASTVSVKAVVSVSEMADLCQISRSRWYEMVASGIFPKPIQLPSVKRPVYDRSLQERCLEIRATGIGLNGPVLFNRKPKKAQQSKPKTQRPAIGERLDPVVEPILEALKDLGLSTTPKAVGDAVSVLFPSGIAGQEQGDVVRRVFLHLQSPKK
jgi:hypothetical protein